MMYTSPAFRPMGERQGSRVWPIKPITLKGIERCHAIEPAALTISVDRRELERAC